MHVIYIYTGVDLHVTHQITKESHLVPILEFDFFNVFQFMKRLKRKYNCI